MKAWALYFYHKKRISVWSVRSTRRECRELQASFKGACDVVKVNVEAV